MKTLWLSLCVGMLWAAVPCRAQSPSSGEPTPLLLVYVARYGDNVEPLIALGLEKPALTINTFEKCVTMEATGGGLAAQLKPDDAKTLVAALEKADSDHHQGISQSNGSTDPQAVLRFTTPDHKLLGVIATANSNASANIIKAGVLEFTSGDNAALIAYLTEKLHPK